MNQNFIFLLRPQWKREVFGMSSLLEKPAGTGTTLATGRGTGVCLEAVALEATSGKGQLVSPPIAPNTSAKERDLLDSSALRVTRATWAEATPEGLKGKS